MKGKAIEVLAVLAPDEAVRAGDVMPEGRADRCGCCGKRISWRAVVRVGCGEPLFYGLTCAGIRTSEGKRRMRAERLLALDAEWLAWADGIELRGGTLGEKLRGQAATRPVEVLEAWARSHGASLSEVNFSVLDFGGRDEDLLGELRGRSYLPRLEKVREELSRMVGLGLAEVPEEVDRERVIVMVLGGTEGFIRRGAAAWAPAVAGPAAAVVEMLDAVRAEAGARATEAGLVPS